MTDVPTLAAHIGRALKDHVTWCRTNGTPTPPELVGIAPQRLDLLARFVQMLVGTGPERTSLAALGDLPDAAPVPIAYTFVEAGQLLRVTERQIRRLVQAGELQAISVGGQRRIHRDDLTDYATRLRMGAGTDLKEQHA